MFSNYFKIAFRNLLRNKLHSAINIIGLGIAIGICITSYVVYQYSRSFDQFHIKKDNVHMIYTNRIVEGNRIHLCNTPTPITSALQNEVSGIRQTSRLVNADVTLRLNGKAFNEIVTFVDKPFFDMFTFPVIQGSSGALNDPAALIVTEGIAKKYFGQDNAIGKQLVLSTNGKEEHVFSIQGIIEKPGRTSSIQLGICIPYSRQEDMLGYDIQSWSDWTTASFVELEPGASLETIRHQLQNYVPLANQANINYPIHDFDLVSLSKLSSLTPNLRGHSFMSGFGLAQIIVPAIAAMFALILASINFINTSIASAARRLKEIGIRKTIGGVRRQLLLQFMGENLILCGLALVLGLLLMDPFLAFISDIISAHTFTFKLNNINILIYIVVLLLVTTLASGAYPAVYISNFKPVEILKDKVKIKSAGKLIRILLTVQFMVSIIAILSGLILYKNNQFIQSFDYGFNKDQVLVVPLKRHQNYSLLKNALQKNPAITQIGATRHLLGRSWTGHDIKYQDDKIRVQVLNTGENYTSAVGFSLLEGELFDDNLKMQNKHQLLINETMQKTLGLTDAVGRNITITSEKPPKEYQIIGVVQDYYMNGLWQRIQPAMLRYADEHEYQYLYAQCSIDNLIETAEFTQAAWETLFPHLPYDGFYQSDILAEALYANQSITTLFTVVAVILLLTASFGLFALVSLNVARRNKEIGIRRVLGASFSQVCYLISKEFLILILVASVLGSAIGYFMLKAFLASLWAYHTEFNMAVFMMTTFILLMTALLTVGFKVVSVALGNPVEALKYE